MSPINGHFHKPRAGDKFWDRAVFLEETQYGKPSQPNGVIRNVNWGEKEILVQFHDKAVRTYTLDDILGCWEGASFGGCWMLYPKLTMAERFKLAGIT